MILILAGLLACVVGVNASAEVKQGSCRNQCFSAYRRSLPCQCNNRCPEFGNCCDDFYQECLPGSCQNQCFSAYRRSLPCQCNNRCPEFGNCCDDFYQECLPGSCKGRCSDRNSTFSCQCDAQCRKNNDCCQDFLEVCTTNKTCRFLCGARFDKERTCQCNSGCEKFGDCCDDYATECRDFYICNGVCNVIKGGCSCLESCVNDNSCCTDYHHSCGRGRSWLEEACSPREEMTCPKGFKKPPVILFSIDGFRNSYLFRNITPNLWKLASCGVHSPYIRPVYPTLTFPNHYTIATGLYPESHGIIANRFYDRILQDEFRIGRSTRHPKWWGGEPIWVTASNQGFKTASYFWVGSDVNITRYPDYYFRYDSSIPDEERVYQVLKWLKLPDVERPSLITLYISKVDKAGHKSGPDGEDVYEEIRNADKIVGMLMDGLKSLNLDNCADLIILSDHGMANTSCDGVTYADKYAINISDVYIRGGANGRIGKGIQRSNEFNAKAIMDKLMCKRNETHFQAFLKYQNLPKRFHYAYNNRIDDVIIILDDEWLLGKETGTYSTCDGGTHGWDNQNIQMRAIFVAHGSSFKRNYNTSLPVDVIEIYNLICDLMDLDPAPNNGTWGSMRHLLQNPQHSPAENNLDPSEICVFDESNRVTANELGCDACVGNFSTSHLLENNVGQDFLSSLPRMSSQERSSLCLLSHPEFVTAFHKDKRMPCYAFFLLESETRDMSVTTPCIRPDVRIPHHYSPTCYELKESENISAAFLYSPTFSKEYAAEASILSNVIPVYKPFSTIWKQFAKVLNRWSVQYDGISVITGPVFDFNYDGVADSSDIISDMGQFSIHGENISLPIPTHVFAVVTKCKWGAKRKPKPETCYSSPDHVKILSFIIPNFSEDPCYKDSMSLEKWVSSSLYQHVARVRDVELLTGLSFFPDWTAAVNTSDNGTLLKLHLPEFGSEWMEEFLTLEEKGQHSAETGAKDSKLKVLVIVSLLALSSAVTMKLRQK